MTASLVLALITIAGLGILALVLIFFGGSKKQQAKYAKEKQGKDKLVKKNEEENISGTRASSHAHSHKEPYISEDFAETEEDIIIKSHASVNAKVDPAISSLGFSALDNLLSDPETNAAQKTIGTPTNVTPVEFNSAPKKKAAKQDIIVLHVMAPAGQPFVGYELLQSVTTAGLRFGKMDIFHYYDEEEPTIVLFSLCSAVEPGSFDIANMGALVCPGLSLFMQISAVANPKAVFNLMLETAGQLADDLAGYVCDEKRQPLTDEKLHEYLTLTAKRNEYA